MCIRDSLIGERTAEEIKIGIGTCYNKSENQKMEVRGRNLVTGLPKTIEVTSEETEEALREVTTSIIDAVHRVLEQTPPELAADIAVRGIVLTGGGCLLNGLDEPVSYTHLIVAMLDGSIKKGDGHINLKVDENVESSKRKEVIRGCADCSINPMPCCAPTEELPGDDEI